MPLKIALLHYTAPPIAGGVESVLARHAELMAADGHEVTVFAGQGEQWDPRIGVVCLPAMSSRDARVLAAKAELDRGVVPPDFHRLADEIEASLSVALDRFDTVVMHNVCSQHKNLALTSALRRLTVRRRTRWIAWHHDFAWGSDQYREELHDGPPWDLLRTAWPGVRQVVISAYRARQFATLASVSLETAVVVPNGIDIEGFFKLEPASRDSTRRHDLFRRQPLLLTPVRVTRRKNLELAIRVTGELRKLMPDVVLLITGPLGAHNPSNAAYFDELAALRDSLGLRQQVIFLANERGAALHDVEVPDWYRLSDALLLTSEDEGFGLPVLEAALAGLPVFCTDIPPLRELAGEHATYFAASDDPAHVAARIAARLGADAVFSLRTRHRASSSWETIYNGQIKPLLEAGMSP